LEKKQKTIFSSRNISSSLMKANGLTPMELSGSIKIHITNMRSAMTISISHRNAIQVPLHPEEPRQLYSSCDEVRNLIKEEVKEIIEKDKGVTG
jgi:hypothetical protein